MTKDTPTIKWLFKQVKRYIPSLILITIITMVGSYISVRYSLASRDVVDAATGANDKDLLQVIAVLAIMVVASLVLRLVRRNLAEKTAYKMNRNWKTAMMHEILYADYSKTSAYHSGNLLDRMNADVNTVDSALISLIPGVLGILTQLVSAIIIMIQLDVKLTVALCLAGIVLIIISAFLRDRIKELHKKTREANAKVNSFIQESISRLFAIQALDAANEIEKRENEVLEERYQLQLKRKNLGLITSGGLNAVFLIGEFCVLVWCAINIKSGIMTFGTLIAMVQLFSKIESPLIRMSGIIPKYSAAIGSAERIKEIYELNGDETPEGLLEPVDEKSVYDSMLSINGEDICFRYEDSQGQENVLDNVSFEIKKGSFVAITGQSGIGKSTLLKLLPGVYKPDSGRLYIEETDLKELAVDRTTRSLFAYVPQGNMLFSGTLRENLLLTRPDATDEELANAIRIADMEAFILELPEGLDTKIGENALGISEGQAQRVSIARAVLSGKPVILLDEATSALDAETERRVLSNIKAIPDITAIAVTHRPAAVEMSDTVIELH